MSTVPLFAGVFNSHPSNADVNYLPRVKSTKRKRGRRESSASHESIHGIGTERSATGAAASNIKPEQLAQYKLAGQSFDQDSPGPNFPHEASKTGRQDGLDLSEDGHTAAGDFAPAIPSQVGLRKQHVSVLTSLLHRCMLEGDYVRAGRAWGMLLRVDVDGKSVDLRTNGNWGLGAEILMFRDTQIGHSQAPEINSPRGGSSDGSDSIPFLAENSKVPLFSMDGFSKAKDYYERLTLQHPYRKAVPHTVSSVDFYPAMFGLWIYSIQEQGKIVYNTAKEEKRWELQQDEEDELHAIRRQALEQAVEISVRLDELLVSPPYSDSSKLWRLRGMVAEWEADLIRLTATAVPDSDALPADDDSMSGSPNLHQEKLMAVKSKAKQAFDTVARLDKGPTLDFPNIEVL